MRDAERRHAARWEARIREPGGELPPPPSGWRARWLGLLARLGGLEAVLVSAGLSIAALFVIGLLKTLFTDLSWLRSGLEMVIIGLFATVITYLIGTLFGVQLS
jgi:hypothetical protein